jgi:peptidoglycan/xylan/chitin deacetylase (PgdA/CDA1 family)
MLFPACSKPVTTPPKTNLNAYMPPLFEQNFIDYIPEDALNNIIKNNENTWDVSDVDVSYIDENRRLIAFTFDDTPAKTLENILTVFTSYNEENPDCKATASLFVNGGLISESSQHLLHLAYAYGFELGNHTQNHRDLTTLTKEELLAEIDTTDTILEKIDGKKRHLLRAPFGRTNELFKTVAGAPIIDWTIDTLDWTNIDAEKITEQVMKEKFSGGIVLMHDGYQGTVDALKQLLPALKAEGYQVVSVSAMAKMHNCVLKNGTTYIRARKKQA